MDVLELKARRDFVEWFCKHFHFVADNNYNVTLDQIVDLFEFVYEERRKIDCPLGRNHIHEILFANGYLITDDQTMLPLGLKCDAFTERSDAYCAKFLALDFNSKDKANIRRIRSLNSVTKSIRDADHSLGSDAALQLLQFYTTWCADTREVFDEIPTAWKRAIVGRLQKVYRIFCEINNYKPVDMKVLRKFLINKGHSHCTGSYACGMSGQSYFTNLYTPGTGYFHKASDGLTADGEIEFAAVHNQLVLRIGGYYYVSDGTEVIVSEGALKKNLSERLKNIVPGMDSVTSAISKEGGDDIVSLEEDSRLDNSSTFEALQVGNDLVESARKSKEGSSDTDASADSFVDNSSSVDLADNQTDIDAEDEFTEDQLEGPTGLGEFTDTENALANSEVEVDDETVNMLSRLGFTPDKVEAISGKKLKTSSK